MLSKIFYREVMVNRRTSSFKLLLGIVLITIFLLISTNLGANASGNAAPVLQSDGPEYTPQLMLAEEDLPGFHMASETEVVGHLTLAERLTAGLFGANTRIANVASFSIDDPFRSEFIISFLAYPLSEDDETNFDALASNPQLIIESLQAIAQTSGSAVEPRFVPGMGDLGDSSMGFFLSLGQEPVAQDIDFLWVRRGEILQATWLIYPVGETPTFDARHVGLLVDQRVQEHFIGTTFRQASLYVPDLTTHIPTPLDVSIKPAVIGANLLLAALMMLPFVAAVTLFTRLVSESEVSLRQRVRLPGWFSKLRRKDAPDSGSKGRRRAGRILRISATLLFYGVIFSLLDRTWRPFTITGLLLLLSMILAYGIVGIAGDIVQWRALRKWGTPAELSLRPTNILLSIGSALASRLLALVPGLMFGTPQALVVDEARLDDRKRNNLLRISALTLTAIGSGLWILTIATGLLQRGSLSASTSNVIGGLEAFLLMIFAVTLENIFAEMVGFSGSFGEALRRKNPWLWMLSLTGISFLFYHTLINPRGELAEALQESNVLVLLGVSGAFMLFTLAWWLIKRTRGGTDRTGAKTAARKTRRKSTPKRTSKRTIPVWFWLVVIVVGLMVIGAFRIIRQNMPQFRADSITAPPESTVPLIISATPTISDPPAPAVSYQVNPEFTLPALVEGPCYLPVESVANNIVDRVIWRGMQLAATQFGTQAAYADPLTSGVVDYDEAIGELVQRDCGVIVGYSLLRETFITTASDHPTQNFLLLGDLTWQSSPANLWVTHFDLGQGTYLAGYLAAAISDSGKVGAFRMDFPAFLPTVFPSFLDCYVRGADDYNQAHQASVSVLGWDVPSQQGLFADSFRSPEQGRLLSEQLIAQGADVLLPLAGFGVGSTSYEAGLSALDHAGVTVIGVDADWAWATPELADVVLTSIETRFDQSIAIALQALVDGSFSGREHSGTLASGEIGFSPLRGFANQVSSELTAELAQIAAAPPSVCQPPQPAGAEPTLPVLTPLPSPSPTVTPTATSTPTPTPPPGEKINLFNLQAMGISRIEFPAGNPFYIAHGYGFLLDDYPPEAQAFFLEVDGIRRDPDGTLAQPWDDDESIGVRWLFNFPDGMTGTHTFTGTWMPPDGEGSMTETLIVDFVP